MRCNLLGENIWNQLDRKNFPQKSNHLPKDGMNVSIFEPLQTILSNLKYVIIKLCKNKNACSRRDAEPDLNPIWTTFREYPSLSPHLIAVTYLPEQSGS